MERKVARLNFPQITEKFFNEAVESIGGKRIDELFAVPDGKRNCDYIIGDVLIELKFIEKEALESDERKVKISEILYKIWQNDPSKENLTISRGAFPDDLYFQYWNAYASSVFNRVRECNRQIRDTREILGNPNLRGWAFIVNKECDSLNPQALQNFCEALISRRHKSLNGVATLTMIPGYSHEHGKPVIVYDFTSTKLQNEYDVFHKLGIEIRDRIGRIRGRPLESVIGSTEAVDNIRNDIVIGSVQGNQIVLPGNLEAIEQIRGEQMKDHGI